MKLLVFPGARRAESWNRKLARWAASRAEQQGALVDFAEMREFDVPVYDGDDEKRDGVPEGAQALARRVTAADAFLISSPEYNMSVPGALKNLIDWTSRLRTPPWRGKCGLLLSASPSLVGGNRGLWTLRVPLEVLGAQLHPDMFSLAQAHKAFAADGSLADEALAKRLDQLVAEFLARVRKIVG